MKSAIHFTVYGVAIPKGSTRSLRHKKTGAIVTLPANAKTRPWQQEVTSTALAARPLGMGPLRGAVVVAVMFYLPRPKSLPKKVVEHIKKPDLDKLIRCIKDALTNVFWVDDAQVVRIVPEKRYAGGVLDPLGAEGVPRAEFVITERAERGLFQHAD